MKKLFTVALIAFMSVSMFAQFGIKAGLNLANEKAKFYGKDLDTKMIPAFHVGAFYRAELSNDLFLEPSLLLTQKGSKIESDFRDVTIRPIYLEIPVLAGFKLNNFFVNAGPFLGFGIGGKIKSESKNIGDNTTSIKFGTKDDSDLKITNMGLMIGGGIEFNKIIIGLNYQLGLTNNLPKHGDKDNMRKDRNIMISLGYAF